MAKDGAFERHRQPWTTDEIQKLHQFAKKGMALKAISRAMTRSEESIRDRARSFPTTKPSPAEWGRGRRSME